MFVWAPLPEKHKNMSSLDFSKLMLEKALVAVSPGIGFGPMGEGHVRFALIENPQRSPIAPQNNVGSSPVYVVLKAPAKCRGRDEVHRSDIPGFCRAFARIAQVSQVRHAGRGV